MLRFKERLKPLSLLLALPLIVGFTTEYQIPPEELDPPPMSPVEEILLIERAAHLTSLQRDTETDRLIEKQQHLQELGWYEGEIDGIKGPLTQKALEEFIAEAGLEDTSQANVLLALREDDAPGPPPPPEPEPAESAPTPPPATTSTSSSANGIPAHWIELAKCESGNWVDGGASFEGPIRWDWAKNGQVPPWGTTIHHGGFQFHPGTWSAYKLDGYPERAYDASPQQQFEVAKRVQAEQGWQAWPTCARMIGLL